MGPVLLDTHAWAWTRLRPERISRAVADALSAADAILISPVSLYEMVFKIQRGRWPELRDLFPLFAGQVDDGVVLAADVTPEIALKAARFDWEHPDPFDRILAATALVRGASLVTADRAFTAPGAPALRVVW